VCITKLCSGVSSSNHANGTSNSFEILDKVAIAEDVCPFSILDSKLLDIPHSSAISCCVFCCFNLNCLIFIPICLNFFQSSTFYKNNKAILAYKRVTCQSSFALKNMCQLLLGKLFIAIFTEVTSCTLLFQHLSNAF